MQLNQYQTGPHMHLFNAMYNWILENDGRPHIVVPLAEVPAELHHLGDVKAGVMVLNIAPRAVGNFEINHEALSFNCRFNKVQYNLCIRTNQLLRIMDQLNPNVFMDFPTVVLDESASVAPEKKRPSLSVVK